MPLYSFLNDNTSEIEEHTLKISELPSFIADNPHLTQQISAPRIGDSVRQGITKTPDSFNSLLKNIKKRYYGSTIETR